MMESRVTVLNLVVLFYDEWPRPVLIVIAFLFEVKVLVAKSLPKYTGDLLIIYRCISRNGHVTKDIPKYFVLQ